MFDRDRRYGVRYMIQEWNKPVEGNVAHSVPGITAMKGDFGFADELLVASIMRQEDGRPCILLLDSATGANPRPELLREVRNMIDHYLKHHT